MRRALLLALAGTLACGDDEAARPDAGATTDAAAGGAPDATAPDDAAVAAGLIGTWRHRVEVDQPSEATDAVYVFAPDGSFTFDEEQADDHLAGTWELSGDTLTLDGVDPEGAEVHIESTFYLAAAGDLLLTEALLPDGPVDGVVGSWRGQLHVDAVEGREAIRFGADLEITLAADGTGRLIERPYSVEPEDPHTRAIDWTLDGDVFSYPGPFGPLRHLWVDGAAISMIVLERLE